MATMQMRLVGTSVKQQMEVNARRQRTRIAIAARKTYEEAGSRIVDAGKADMLKGGNFGSARWQNSLHADVLPKDTLTANVTLSIKHRVPFWRVFEFGARILGKPLLWIPLPWNPNKVRARDFPGQLFRVDRKGKNPLLMQSKGKGEATAMYVGVKSVFLKRRFHLRTIIRRVARQTPFLFKKWMRIARTG